YTTPRPLDLERHTEPLRPGARQDDGGRGHVLHPDAGQVAHGDLRVAAAAGVLPGGDVSQLAGDLALGDRPRGHGVVDLPEPEALGPAVRHDQIGAPEDVDVELLLVGAVRSDGGDVHAGGEPGGFDQRLAARRDGEDDVGPHDRLADGGDRDEPALPGHGGVVPELLDAGAGPLGAPAVDAHLAEGAHEGQRSELVPGLVAAADDADDPGVAARQVLRRHGPRRAGALLGDEPVVEEKGRRLAGSGVEHQDHAVVLGQPFGGVVVEAGGDLDGIVGAAAQVAG